ncbi:unnamed protein product [Nezara viridula]|uniref:Uncharacterized protein n=1 Tax=Nezara viridula TaxID=85310 RepID=A0A9P0HRW8_NEZVI|nr:unnamed protein product [Nezara viridula]
MQGAAPQLVTNARADCVRALLTRGYFSSLNHADWAAPHLLRWTGFRLANVSRRMDLTGSTRFTISGKDWFGPPQPLQIMNRQEVLYHPEVHHSRGTS